MEKATQMLQELVTRHPPPSPSSVWRLRTRCAASAEGVVKAHAVGAVTVPIPQHPRAQKYEGPPCPPVPRPWLLHMLLCWWMGVVDGGGWVGGGGAGAGGAALAASPQNSSPAL